MNKKKAILLFSGGQDSTTILGWCLKNYKQVYLLSFDYGQNHRIELRATKKIIKEMTFICKKYNSNIQENKIYKINSLSNISKNALTSNIKIDISNKIPNTFVPGRNLLFFTLACTYGYDKSIFDIVSGVCQTDYSGYPDCRNKTLNALKKAINLGTESKYKFHSPLMNKSKAETWELAYKIGGKELLEIIKKHTHTCYKGNRKKYNSWGYGCGKCPACLLRKKGWNEFKKKYQI